MTRLHYSTHVWDKGIAAFRRAARAGEEGVMAKLSTSLYYSGDRTREWLKVKASQGQEVVIVGFTAPKGSRRIVRLAPACGARRQAVALCRPRRDRLQSRDAEIALREAEVPLITTTKPVAEKVPDAATPPG